MVVGIGLRDERAAACELADRRRGSLDPVEVVEARDRRGVYTGRESERAIGEAVRGVSEDVIVATKGGEGLAQ